MEPRRRVLSWMKRLNPAQNSDPVSLGTRRAILTFLLIMGMAVLLVAAISKALH